jgi:hypothetical protein
LPPRFLIVAPLYWRTIVFRAAADDADLARLNDATLAALRAL